MKLNRKWMLVLALVLSVAMATGGTLAYLTDRDTEVNVFTMGNVDIELKEDFEQDSELIPGLDIEKEPTITNVGPNDAWVWATIAIPSALDNDDASANVVHFNMSKDSVAEGKWTWWKKDSRTEWLKQYNVEYDGVNYNVFTVLYQTALKKGDTTEPVIYKVYMDPHVDIAPDGQLHHVENGKVTKLDWNINTNGNPKIYVSAYAMQTNEFADVYAAYEAYTAQWSTSGKAKDVIAWGEDDGETDTNNPPEAKLPTTSWLDNSDTSWYDASKNEYSISTAAELAGLSELVNEQGVTFRGKTVTLTKSVDLGDHLWTPVGQTGAGHGQFGGTFDGNNKTISNLYIDTTAKDSGTYATGLFGWLNTATVKNTKVDGAVIKGNQYVGVIAGYMESISTCTISNCSVNDAKVTAIHKNNNNCGDKVGVIVGYAGNAGSIVVNCSATKCAVAAGRDAGQIAGAARIEVVTDCTATNVTVSATKGCNGTNIKEDIIGRKLN